MFGRQKRMHDGQERYGWPRLWLVLSLLLLPHSLFAQSDSYYPETIRQGWGPRCLTGEAGPFRLAAGVGMPLQGVGATIGMVNNNSKADLLLLGLNNPPEQNRFQYRILWDIDPAGASAGPPSAPQSVPGLGWEAQGAGIAMTELDGNARPELLVMAYDNPPGDNEFRYRVGWNLDGTGKAASWSAPIAIPGFGNPASNLSGAGIATGFVDGNAQPDMLLTAVGPATKYKIGFNIDSYGNPVVWSTTINVPSLLGPQMPDYDGFMGGDGILADIDLDGVTDVLIAAYARHKHKKSGAVFYRIGWNLSQAGIPTVWSRVFRLSGFGDSAGGLGLAHIHTFDYRSALVVADHKGSGKDEFDDIFRYNVLPLTTSGTAFGVASDPPPKVDDVLNVPTGLSDTTAEKLFNLNMSSVRSAARDAVMTFWFNALLPGANSTDWHDYPDASGNFAIMLSKAHADLSITPDFSVAAVAWYVDRNMGYTFDDSNEFVLNTFHQLAYPLGGSYIPAYYTIRYTNPFLPANSGMIAALKAQDPGWAKRYGDGKSFHGDCEDYAVLRHALLRALGFDRRFIWNAKSPSHEHNVVLYNGALRIMDYGPIQKYLCCTSSINSMPFQSWNTDYGPAVNSNAEGVFWHQVATRTLPDLCGETGWLFSRHSRPELDSTCAASCK
jgi:hypothetical protein